MAKVKGAEIKTLEEKEALAKAEKKKANKPEVKRRVGRPKTRPD
jgi:hypothetical protein